AIVIPAASLQQVDPISFRGMPLARRLIGMKLVTTGGKAVGKVTDLCFDPTTDAAFLQVEDEGNVLQRLMRQATTLPMIAIQTFGQDVLIISEDAAKRHLGEKR
ncbi:MAG TPA: PRC-barrel domain-containing protein, partial [Ktedonobacterales bacterium]